MVRRPERGTYEAVTEISNRLICGLDIPAFLAQMSRQSGFIQAAFTKLCLSWLHRVSQLYADKSMDVSCESEFEEAFRFIKSK